MLAPAPASADVVCSLSADTQADLLGAAGPYSEFVAGDVRQINEVEGRVAVGDDFRVSTSGDVGFRTGFALPPEARPSLVVGGSITSTGSFIQLLTDRPGVLGSATYGNEYHAGPRDEGTFTRFPPPFSFTDTFTYLRALAAYLDTCQVSPGATVGTYLGTPQTLLLTGTNAALNVFRLTAAQLQATRSVYLDVPIGATTLVTVTGASYSTEVTPNADFWIRDPDTRSGAFVQVLHCGLGRQCFMNTSAGPIGPQQVPHNVVEVQRRLLWNFPQAEHFTKGAVSWSGSILAPDAHLQWGPTAAAPTVGLGSFEGQVILASVDSGISQGGLEVHVSERASGDLLFVGRLPVPEEAPEPPQPPQPPEPPEPPEPPAPAPETSVPSMPSIPDVDDLPAMPPTRRAAARSAVLSRAQIAIHASRPRACVRVFVRVRVVVRHRSRMVPVRAFVDGRLAATSSSDVATLVGYVRGLRPGTHRFTIVAADRRGHRARRTVPFVVCGPRPQFTG
jgi:choice-of-anchor A domain-containing protein